jgi:hypothetical protein
MSTFAHIVAGAVEGWEFAVCRHPGLSTGCEQAAQKSRTLHNEEDAMIRYLSIEEKLLFPA